MLTETLNTNAGRDWAIARAVQQRFMERPDPSYAAADACGHCRQVHELGGDCYNFVPLSDNRLALAIGDASGKGLAAALMISNVQSSLRTAALFMEEDTAAVIQAVNQQVYATSLADRFATLFYGVLDAATLTLRYVNAGHNPPVVIRRDGSIEKLQTGGSPVGMFPEWDYEESAIQLHPGDVVVAYTDGATEAMNVEGEEWGMARLSRAAVENRALCAEEIVDAMFTEMDVFTQGTQIDDATFVVLRVR